MSTTRPPREQATEPTQSDDYQPLGRQQAPTNREALYGGNADDNSGSGGNAKPTNATAKKKAPQAKGDKHSGSISGASSSGGTGSSGTSSGQVTL